MIISSTTGTVVDGFRFLCFNGAIIDITNSPSTTIQYCTLEGGMFGIYAEGSTTDDLHLYNNIINLVWNIFPTFGR